MIHPIQLKVVHIYKPKKTKTNIYPKMANKDNSILNQVLKELQELRQDSAYIQRTLVRMEAASMPYPTPTGPNSSTQLHG